MKRLAMWMVAALLSCTMGWAGAADTLLGPADVIKVSVYGSPDLTLETRVSDNGSITFPLIGPVAVGGLTVAAAEKKVASLLESGGFLKAPQVNILVTVITSQQVSVLGQVNRPGRYPLDGKRNLLDMLAQAGGIAADGGDAVSLVRRRNGAVTKDVIDIVRMVRSGELTEDFELAAGDVIYVERAPRFYIYGEVQRPGMFRLERAMTVMQALSSGGGLTQRGTERGMQLHRRDASGKLRVIDASRDEPLQPDDVVYVKESLF